MVNSYVALDFETTGLSAKEDKVIEIGALKVIEGKIVDTISTFVDPCVKIPGRITELTGITDAHVAGAPKDKEAMRDLLDFCEDLVILGHNIRFDYSFLKVWATNNKIVFDRECIDTLRIARKVLPDLPSRSLDFLTAHFDLLHEEKHRALSDAKAAAILYEDVLKKKYDGNEAAFEPVKFDMKFKKQSDITPKQVKYLKDLIARYGIDPECEIESLTKNAASRMIDRIRFEYGGR